LWLLLRLLISTPGLPYSTASFSRVTIDDDDDDDDDSIEVLQVVLGASKFMVHDYSNGVIRVGR
jgi:hypothetical protein